MQHAKNIGPFLRTIRYIPPSKLVRRVVRRVKSSYYETPLFSLFERIQNPTDCLVVNPPVLWKGDAKKGALVAENQFSYIGRDVNFGANVDWFPKQVSALWMFHLHYHDDLGDFRAMKSKGVEPCVNYLRSWIEECGGYQKVAWHPYPMSLRLVNWFTHYDFFEKGMSDELKADFWECVSWQVELLKRSIETDIGGNHLIKNIKALIFAGLCLKGHQSDYLDAMALLLEEIKIQILPDGGHYERSPHYHVIVLKDLLDIHALILKAGQTPPHELDSAIDSMAEALAFMVYPDGHLGLFNDGILGNAKDISAVMKRTGVKSTKLAQLPETGYVRLSRKKTFLFMDAGLCCPDSLPGHAHADMLAMELLVNGERVVVNQGTYGYQHKNRNQMRGTQAHSTLCFNKTDSAEVWHVFRLGRRPRKVEAFLKEETGTGIGVDASHDGYRHLGLTHHRRIFISENGLDIRGEDTLVSKKNMNGDKNATIHFHLAPHIHVSQRSEKEIEIQTKENGKLSFKVQGARLYDAQSVYAPQFGEKERSRQIILSVPVKGKETTVRWAFKILKDGR